MGIQNSNEIKKYFIIAILIGLSEQPTSFNNQIRNNTFDVNPNSGFIHQIHAK